MSISVECPACEFTFSVPDSYAGKRGKCPECGNVSLAPEVDDLDAAVDAAASIAPSPAPGGGGVNLPAPKRLAARNAAPAPLPVAEAAPPLEDFSATLAETSNTKFPHITKKGGPQAAGVETAPSQRRKSTTARLWIAAAAGAVLVGGLVAIIVANSGSDDHIAEANRDNPKPPPANSVVPDGATPDDNTTPDNPHKPRITQAELNELWKDARHQVCKLEVTTLGEHGTDKLVGTAFVIDSRGWVATNYHLIRDAKAASVVVRVPDVSYQQSFTAQGIIAEDPAHDIAILAVDFKKANPHPLTLQPIAGVESGQDLVACQQGDGSWLRACRAHSVLPTADLPRSCQAAVRQRKLDETQHLTWIQHDAPLAECDSGSPLLDRRGKVIGISTSLGSSSASGYALPIRHLVALKDAANGEVKPFGQEDMVAVKPVDPPHVDPPSAKPEPGTQESLVLIRNLQAECEKMDWMPKTMSDYKRFQELAVYVTAANVVEDDPDIAEDFRILIGSVATEVMQALNTQKWPGDAGLAEINSLATDSLKQGMDGDGLFAYVEIALPTKESPAVDGVPTIVCELIGTDQLVIIPVAISDRGLTKKSRWLVLGNHDRSAEYQVSIDGKPQRPAVWIQTKHLLGQPKVKKGP